MLTFLLLLLLLLLLFLLLPPDDNHMKGTMSIGAKSSQFCLSTYHIIFIVLPCAVIFRRWNKYTSVIKLDPPTNNPSKFSVVIAIKNDEMNRSDLLRLEIIMNRSSGATINAAKRLVKHAIAPIIPARICFSFR